MPDLLLELFSEEIPARMQQAAAKDLERLVVGALADRGLMFEGARAFAGPRRLTLAMSGLPAKQPDTSEERKGPRVGAPEKALEGFLRSAGVFLEQCIRQADGKGEFYVAVIDRKGRETAEVLAEVLPGTIAKLPWPKSMRWTAAPTRWVRPLRGIVCTFDGEIVPFEFAGAASGNVTFGHRFLSHGPIEVRRFEDYEAKLRAAYVILDGAERKESILHEARQKAFALGLELIEDEGLLGEVAGLAEWPVVFMGRIEDRFMDVPPEILQTSMRAHQKYFALRDPKTGSLAARFIVVAGTVARDGGKEIVAGNERVLRARLSDAKFFWEQDRKRTLEGRVEDLKKIVFHAKLGSQYERVERIEALAGEIAAEIGADVGKAKRAARLCKADLTTGVVGEFPELQGVMGRYYALHDGEDAEVADAIRDHYKPVGPSDNVPSAPVSVTVALADKLDSLVGFFAIEERPTGSKDPFALRRAALGIVRLLLRNKLRMAISSHAFGSFNFFADQLRQRLIDELFAQPEPVIADEVRAQKTLHGSSVDKLEREFRNHAHATAIDVGAFAVERLKIQLREEGARYDLVDAVFARADTIAGGTKFISASLARNLGVDDPLLIVRRVEALQTFLNSDDGANLLAGYRRAANILRIEEKRDGRTFDGVPAPDLFREPEETALRSALSAVSERIFAHLEREDFVAAMQAMAELRSPVDAFFERVKVNDAAPEVRENRLLLLSALRRELHKVADFSRIEG